jgi:hypothetical protein
MRARLSEGRPLLVLLIGVGGFFGWMGSAHTAAAADPTMSCETGPVPLALDIGKGFPLPRSLSNPTSDRLRLSVTLNSPRFFGPPREVLAVTLDAGMGRTQSVSPIVPVPLSTPLGQGVVALELRADKTGDTVFKRCEYDLDLRRGLDHERLIQVPVMWCAFEASATAGQSAPGQTVSTTRFQRLIDRVNDDVWVPQAEIAFTPPPGLTTMPVIADKIQAPGVPKGVFEDGVATDLEVVGHDCEAAWQTQRPGTIGIPLIAAREIQGAAEGSAPGYSTVTFGLNATRHEDLCTVPRGLTSADMVDQVLIAEDGKSDEALFHIVAHELGHTMYLSHGNGLDDNGDGLLPPQRGVRRFDNPCDALMTDSNTSPREDAQTPGSDCTATRTLMHYTTTPCLSLRPLQRELARDAARLHPGARVPPLLPIWLVGLAGVIGISVLLMLRRGR